MFNIFRNNTNYLTKIRNYRDSYEYSVINHNKILDFYNKWNRINNPQPRQPYRQRRENLYEPVSSSTNKSTYFKQSCIQKDTTTRRC